MNLTRRLKIRGLLTIGLATWGANGQLFVVNNAAGLVAGYVGEYTTSGATINASLISGLTYPWSIASDGLGNLYIGDDTGANCWVRKYTTSGATVNLTLISGLSTPLALALDGQGHLFVANWGPGTIGEYTPACPSLPDRVDERRRAAPVNLPVASQGL